MKRSAIKRSKGLARSGGFKPPRPKAPIEELPRVMWGEDARRGRCIMCGKRRPEGHHVVSKHWLKKNGYTDLLWDRRNMMRLCDDCHDSHEAAVIDRDGTSRRIPREKLNPRHRAFIAEVGLDPWPVWLERTYPPATPT